MKKPYLFFIFVFLLHFAAVKPDLADDRAAILRLRTAVNGRSLLWNITELTPCNWTGVTCESNRVTELRLPGMGLSSQVPAGTVGNLTRLTTLSLRFNALTGQLPSDLGSCTELRYLYLQGNSFSGEIPAFLFTLPNLIRVNLAANNFSGTISKKFNDLSRLGTLYLEQNQLTGSIPNLNQPDLQLNVSFNKLSGSIPKRFVTMPQNAFEGNSLCGGPLSTRCPKKKLSGGAIAGIVIGCLIGVLLLIVLLIFLCRRKSDSKTRSSDAEAVPKQPEVQIGEKSVVVPEAATMAAVVGGGARGEVSGAGNIKSLVFFGNAPRVYDLEDLLRASAEVLGKGTFGTAYKAVLEMGVTVAVKRLKDVTVAEGEFREKIEAVGGMDHENLVPLRAYYFSKDEKLLVYDYMHMGSLSALLHGNRGAGRTPLNWETRSNIALGTAHAITYLHSRSPTTSHGNIKSSNILLTKSYEARVSDFGLAGIVGSVSGGPNRITGYRAPEITDARKISQKADVYSFGVLLLELLTGKAPTHALLNEEGVDLPRWVRSVVQEEWTSEVFDLELLRYQSVEEDMVQLLQLAIDCAAQYPDKRPAMPEVTRQIEAICRSSQYHEPDDVGSTESGAPPVSGVVD